MEGMEPYEMDQEEEARVEAAIEQADLDVAEMRTTRGQKVDTEDARVNMRWPRTQLEVVREAAELFGMPYQTYIKQAAFRAALDDLVKVRTAVQRQQKPAVSEQAKREDAA